MASRLFGLFAQDNERPTVLNSVEVSIWHDTVCLGLLRRSHTSPVVQPLSYKMVEGDGEKLRSTQRLAETLDRSRDDRRQTLVFVVFDINILGRASNDPFTWFRQCSAQESRIQS